jgi:hypothetical protein
MSKASELANLIGNINAGGGGVNRNVIINGAMNVAQRGTSTTGLGGSDGYFTCDRWRHVFNTSGRLTSTQDSSAPSGLANSLKFACTTADTSIASSEYMFLSQRIEGQNVQSFAKGTSDAKPFAVSFYVKGNASATYVAELFDADNSRQISKTFSVTTDWTRIELSFPADTTGALDDDNARSFDLTIWLHGGSDYTSGTLNSSAWASNTNANRAVGISSFFDSTSRTFFITGVQLEVGQNPTSFEHEPVERTLAKCQRYYFVLAEGDDEPILDGGMYNSTIFLGGVTFPVTMRTSPTLDEVEGTNYFNIIMDGGNDLADGIGINRDGNTHCAIEVSGNASGTAGHSAQVRTGNASAKVRFKAEL